MSGGPTYGAFRDSARDLHSTLAPSVGSKHHHYRHSDSISSLLDWSMTPMRGSTPVRSPQASSYSTPSLNHQVARPSSRSSSSGSEHSSAYSSRASSRAPSPIPSPLARSGGQPMFGMPSWGQSPIMRRDSGWSDRPPPSVPPQRRGSFVHSPQPSYPAPGRRSSIDAMGYSLASSYSSSYSSTHASYAPSPQAPPRQGSDAGTSSTNRFQSWQIEGLELVYRSSGPYPSSTEIETLARELSLTVRQVRTYASSQLPPLTCGSYFANRRARS